MNASIVTLSLVTVVTLLPRPIYKNLFATIYNLNQLNISASHHNFLSIVRTKK